jgi:hypothetical protein
MGGTYYADLAYGWATEGNIEVNRRNLMRIVEESRANAKRADELELWKARSLRARKAASKRKKVEK